VGIFSRRPKAPISIGGLVLDRAWADPDLDAAYDAVRVGDLDAGLHLLKDTPVSTDLRCIRVTGLGKAASGRSEQLEARLQALPNDPDLLVWLGQALVCEAWNVRTGLSAEFVSRQRFATFHDILATASGVLDAAIEAAPHDSAPWVVLQWAALGLQVAREDQDQVFRSALARQPDCFAAHTGRVQVLAPKWGGTLADLAQFGDETAVEAQPGRALATIVAMALAEVHLDVISDDSLTRWQRTVRYGREVTDRRDFILATRAKWWRAGHEPEPADIEAHGAMAFALRACDLPYAAMEHAMLTQGRITSVPWAYLGTGEPLVEFATAVADGMT
jgi:hypothetical protein